MSVTAGSDYKTPPNLKEKVWFVPVEPAKLYFSVPVEAAKLYFGAKNSGLVPKILV